MQRDEKTVGLAFLSGPNFQLDAIDLVAPKGSLDFTDTIDYRKFKLTLLQKADPNRTSVYLPGLPQALPGVVDEIRKNAHYDVSTVGTDSVSYRDGH